MAKAPVIKEYVIPGYEDVRTGMVKWPMSVIRLQGKDKERLISAADHILMCWRSYTDEAAFIFAETNGEPHNTITRSPESGMGILSWILFSEIILRQKNIRLAFTIRMQNYITSRKRILV